MEYFVEDIFLKSYLYIVVLSIILSGGGTALGGVLAVLFKKSNNLILSSIMGLAGGLMLSIVAFDLIPEALTHGGTAMTLTGIMMGIVFVTLLDIFMPEGEIIKKYGRQMKMAIILGIGLAAHNFPEGLAVGSGFAGGTTLGFEIAIIIALHDVPEGAAVAAPLLRSTLSKVKIVFITFLTALPTALGALIGAMVANISPAFITLCLGFAGGTMLYIVCGEMIPETKNLWNGVLSTIAIVAGFIMGLLITTAI